MYFLQPKLPLLLIAISNYQNTDTAVIVVQESRVMVVKEFLL